MDLEIFWSQHAEDKLQEIFKYYKVRAGIKISRKIVADIVDRTIDLHKNPKIGAVEELLRNHRYEFRYLVSGNFKIIYYINFSAKRIVIANVFDSRQNPDKIIM